MDRDTIVALLPCYLCDDVPDHVRQVLERALEEDATLRSHLTTLRTGREACAEALAAIAPELPGNVELDLSGLSAPRGALGAPPVAPANPFGLAVAVAACAALVLGGASTDDAPPYEIVLAAAAVAPGPEGPPPVAPWDALLAQGAPPALAMAPDLSAHGFERVAVRFEDGPRAGVVITYEKDGERFHYRIHTAFQTGTAPDAVVDAGGVLLRGFGRGPDASVVSWTSGGRTCLFSGPLPLQDMLAIIAIRVNPRHG